MANEHTPKLIAILHDATFDGDSLFYVTSSQSLTVFPYTGQTLDELKKLMTTAMEDEEWDDEDEIRKDVSTVKGAWILDERGVEIIDAITNVDCGNDSATYRVNSSAKRAAQAIATQRLGEEAE